MKMKVNTSGKKMVDNVLCNKNKKLTDNMEISLPSLIY